MYDIFDIDSIVHMINTHALYVKYQSKAARILDEYAEKSELAIVYPKSLLLPTEGKEVSVIGFYKNELRVFSVGTTFTILRYRYDRIKSLKYSINLKTESNVNLSIAFEDGQEVILSSELDSDENWRYEFSLKIRDIYKYLLAK